MWGGGGGAGRVVVDVSVWTNPWLSVPNIVLSRENPLAAGYIESSATLLHLLCSEPRPRVSRNDGASGGGWWVVGLQPWSPRAGGS